MRRRTGGFIDHYFGENERLHAKYTRLFTSYRNRLMSADKNCSERPSKGYKGRGASRQRRSEDYELNSKRGGNNSISETEQFFQGGVTGDAHADFWTAQSYHARWVVNTFLDACPGMGVRVLKKMDRIRLYMNYDYCKRIRNVFKNF